MLIEDQFKLESINTRFVRSHVLQSWHQFHDVFSQFTVRELVKTINRFNSDKLFPIVSESERRHNVAVLMLDAECITE